MSDPFESLKHLDEIVAGPALPSSEVRRRGDRMRRRRAALRVAAVACAVAVVTAGGIALGGNLTSTTPTPPPPSTQDATPSPDRGPGRTTQALTVPGDFPLEEGMPRVDGDSERQTRTASGTQHLFDPCHNNADAAPEPGRTDLRRVVQTGPAYTVLRELAVYESSSAANEAMLLMKGERERCATYSYEDGISSDVWEVSPVPAGDVAADDRVLGVNRALTEGTGFMTPAGHWIVARVGNAILTLGLDGEFGAELSSIERVADQEASVYQAMVGHLCPFADEGTDIGCSTTSSAAAAGPVEDPGPTYLLDAETLRAATGVEAFATTPDAQMATLACQAEWLAALGPETADYRQFEARTDEGELSAWAGTAVLGFSDEQAAGTAYDTVGEWVSQCDPQVDTSHRLVTAVGTGIGEPHLGDTSAGPYFWRGVKLAAPERCVECDAAWDDHQGAVQVGTRLVLVHVAFAGDMQVQVDDSRLPFEKLLETLAGQTPTGGGASG